MTMKVSKNVTLLWTHVSKSKKNILKTVQNYVALPKNEILLTGGSLTESRWDENSSKFVHH